MVYGPRSCFLYVSSKIDALNFEVGSRKSEVGSRKSEVFFFSEVGSRKSFFLEVKSRKSLLGFRTIKQNMRRKIKKIIISEYDVSVNLSVKRMPIL